MSRVKAGVAVAMAALSMMVSCSPIGRATPAPTAVAVTASRPEALRLGDRGERVVALQRALAAAGWPTVVDGYFGPQTQRSVKGFQQANNLKPTGVAGRKTLRALRSDKPKVPAGRYVHPNPNVDRWWDEALRAGWSSAQWPVVACIMEHPVYLDTAESRGINTAHNPRHPDDSYGLLQLNMRAHRSWVGPMVGWDFRRLFDGETNLRVGKRLYDLAGGWSPWRSTWKRGTCFGMEGRTR